jgi:hypothetical protein
MRGIHRDHCNGISLLLCFPNTGIRVIKQEPREVLFYVALIFSATK